MAAAKGGRRLSPVLLTFPLTRPRKLSSRPAAGRRTRESDSREGAATIHGMRRLAAKTGRLPGAPRIVAPASFGVGSAAVAAVLARHGRAAARLRPNGAKPGPFRS